jgi:P-type Mg2+ transporter
LAPAAFTAGCPGKSRLLARTIPANCPDEDPSGHAPGQPPAESAAGFFRGPRCRTGQPAAEQGSGTPIAIPPYAAGGSGPDAISGKGRSAYRWKEAIVSALMIKLKARIHRAKLARRPHTVGRVSETLLWASGAEPADVLRSLGSSEAGLTDVQVATRLGQYGKNEVAHEKPLPWYWMLLGNFKNPFILVLIGLGVVSYLTDADLKTVAVVSVMVTVSVIMRFFQEFRSSQAAEKLKALVRTTATVFRQREERSADGTVQKVSAKREVPFEDLVPGDILQLSAGDMIPADVRLLSSKDLFVSQSILTGEAMPVEKYDTLGHVVEKTARPNGAAAGNALERDNLCFMGTNIVSGSGTALVVATGGRTYFGSLAKAILGHRSLTSFDKGINRVTWVLIRFILVMVPVIFLINSFVKETWHEAFMFSIAVAVGLTPEMLPMVVTANLARGAVAMARHKVIVKRLNAIQNFGAMDILCTDKTGTLTQDKVILEQHLDVRCREDLQVLRYAYLNSYYQTGLKNLLDRAVLEHVELEHQLHVPAAYRKVDEIPFDFARRRMSVVVEDLHKQHLLICKGAVEEILAVCTRALDEAEVIPLSQDLRQHALFMKDELNADGLRVIAVAYKHLPPLARPYAVADESELILAGFIGFLDPPKESAAPALAALKDNGVGVKILTGDNEIVTRKICKEVGLPIEDVVLGDEVETMYDRELADVAERVTVFAKLTPLQKARIIRALQSKGHTVGYLGDGINDAVALRDADVGISVDSATDIAKESADIILLEKSLLVLEEGVIRGREVYGNIIKYIKMAASSNFGNVFSILVASAFLPFYPMLTIQILIQNLLYDLSQLSLPWDRMDREFLRVPRRWEPGGIARFMVCIGPISSIFDITTFLLMWYVFRANSEASQSLFQSGWFVEGLLSQTLIVHMIRTEKIPFLQSTATLPVVLLTAAIMAFGIFIPFSSLGAVAGLTPLPPGYFPWLLGTLLAYCALTQLAKTWYMKRFKAWL